MDSQAPLIAGSLRDLPCHRYNRMQQVREGFDTTFTYRLSNPSVRCTFMDDVYTKCRYGLGVESSRG